jgi:hypothetical protein
MINTPQPILITIEEQAYDEDPAEQFHNELSPQENMTENVQVSLAIARDVL